MRWQSLVVVAFGVLGASACGGDLTGEPLAGLAPPARHDLGVTTAALKTHECQPDRFRAVADSIEAERAALGAPGVAVAIMEHGKVTFAQGFGQKHPDRADPVLPTTLFRIGSVTKMLTAAALLQLVQDGEVDLGAPITQYVPEFRLSRDPTWAPSIRVRHLLTHSSGLADAGEEGAPDRPDSDLFDHLTGAEFSQQEYLMAPPGRMYNYSNPNFMLAGLITERVSGVPYREYMRKNVFDPLGMHRTRFLGKEVEADGDYAFGKTTDWTTNTGEPALAGPQSYDSAWGRPAGFAWSSVLDLAKFAHFLMHGQRSVLSRSLDLAMQSPQINTEENLDLDYYGYGLAISKGAQAGNQFYPLYLVEHGGAIRGFSAQVFTIPSQGFAFITLANADGAYFNQSLIAAVQALVELPAPLPPPDPGVDPSTFGMYAGTYEDPFNVGPIYVSNDATDLYVNVPLLDQVPIPYDHKLQCYVRHNCLFTMDPNGASEQKLPVTFILDQSGRVEYLRNRSFVAKKLENGEAAALAATTSGVEVPPDSARTGADGLVTTMRRPLDPAALERALRRSAVEELHRVRARP